MDVAPTDGDSRRPPSVADPEAFVLAALAQRPPPALILCGGIGEGKTSAATHLVEALRAQGVAAGGILAPRVVDGGTTVAYQVLDVASGKRQLLLDSRPPGVAVGRFYLRSEGVRFARGAIDRAVASRRLVVIDEVGRLELGGGGHAAALRAARAAGAPLVLTVRTPFVARVVERFALAPCGAHRVAGGGRE